LNQQSCREILDNKLKTEKVDFFRNPCKNIYKGNACVNFYVTMLGQLGYRKNMALIV
jgi:hypothetical protein